VRHVTLYFKPSKHAQIRAYLYISGQGRLQ